MEIQPAGTPDGLMESVTLRPAKVVVEYRPHRSDGTLDAGVFFKYDIKLNREFV